MLKTKNVNFALLGLGKLGQGFYDILQEKKEQIEIETGFNLNLKKILVKHDHFKRPHHINPKLITTNLEDILKDSTIKIVIDAIGGIEPTYTLITQLVKRGIHIISANRMLLASRMHELAELANEHSVFIHPGPSLGGGIPILETLNEYLVANRIKSMAAVVSGTSNYILSEMSRREVSLKEILKDRKIQKLGESLSIIDYEGSDAAQKVSIIASGAFGININFLNIFSEGISDITVFDIRSARQLNYEIKLLAIFKDHDNKFEIHVHPTLVPKDHPLVLIRNEYNAFYIQTDLLGQYMVYGLGVGINPASSSILSSLVALARVLKYGSSKKAQYSLSWNDKRVIDISEIESAYYIRVPCQDMPGVVGKITTILGDQNINIASVHAETKEGTGYAHLLIEKAKEAFIYKSIEEIIKLNIVKGEIKMFRILEFINP